ncbi:putative leader peptide [Pseudonocardia pini]|nr:putative leader peptide [Pseudonocardia pini]
MTSRARRAAGGLLVPRWTQRLHVDLCRVTTALCR